jgi:mannose-1-phosphate guanylyltransferase/mannose-6-phosphate isomerase
MTDPMLFPIILSGGFGGRLWPVSRTSKPKQFLSLLTENTLLQETIFRLSGLESTNAPTLICNFRHRFIAAEQLRAIDVQPRRIYLEPVGRNTAPAVAIAAFDVRDADPDGLMLVLPSDHVILHVPSLHKAIADASDLAQQGYLVTFGILPTAPKTGYGYIRQGDMLENGARGKGYKVAAFVEKPNRETAIQYLKSRSYLWNSGIFMFKAAHYLEELKRLAPVIYEKSWQTYQNIQHDTEFSRLSEELFSQCPDNSIDYAIMEKTDKAVVIPVDMGWSDVGSWGALWEIMNKDVHGNAADGHVYMKDVNNCYIKSDKEIVAALGIDGLIIIDTDNALLVAHMDKEQEVRDVFKKLM